MDTKLVVVASGERDVAEEARHRELNRRGFVRGTTPLDQWYLFVNEAWSATRFPVNETVRDYLVIMLHRFTDRPRLIGDLHAIDFYRHVLGHRRFDPACVQDVADMSLQYVAFFPGLSSYRHEMRTVERVAQIGVDFYNHLARASEQKDDWFSVAYREMAHTFGRAVMVLRTMCSQSTFCNIQRDWTEALHAPTDVEAHRIIKDTLDFEAMYIDSPLAKPGSSH